MVSPRTLVSLTVVAIGGFVIFVSSKMAGSLERSLRVPQEVGQVNLNKWQQMRLNRPQMKMSTTTSSTTTTREKLKFPLHLKPDIPAGDHPPLRVLLKPTTPSLCNGETLFIGAIEINPRHLQSVSEIRDRYKRHSNSTVLPIFFLGVNHDEGVDQNAYLEKIRNISAGYDDIVVGEFEDTYRNLPVKTELLLQWFAEDCPGLQFVLKNDDDVLVNFGSLTHKIQEMISSKNGTLVWQGLAFFNNMGVIHDRNHRNFEDLARDVFPPYTSGPAYLLGREAVERLLFVRRHTTFKFANEDAMLGLLAEGTDSLVPSDSHSFMSYAGQPFEMLLECGDIQKDEFNKFRKDESNLEYKKSLIDRIGRDDCSCQYYTIQGWLDGALDWEKVSKKCNERLKPLRLSPSQVPVPN